MGFMIFGSFRFALHGCCMWRVLTTRWPHYDSFLRICIGIHHENKLHWIFVKRPRRTEKTWKELNKSWSSSCCERRWKCVYITTSTIEVTIWPAPLPLQALELKANNVTHNFKGREAALELKANYVTHSFCCWSIWLHEEVWHFWASHAF